uniref:LamG-like jellyroll fold domain-containing protein n=1 Tax=Flavobacterium sp. TaxID=239 RepID=UPI004049B43A
MKKLLLFLVFINSITFAQTPVWHYSFTGTLAPRDAQGDWGPPLNTSTLMLPTAQNYGVDRFGVPSRSLVVKSNSTPTFLSDYQYYTALLNIPQGSNSRSFSFWIRYRSNASQPVFLQGDTDANIYGMSSGATATSSSTSTIIRTGQNISNTFNHPAWPHIISFNTADDDAWHHYTITSNATQTKIYRNGVLIGTNNIALSTFGNRLKFGLTSLDNNNGSGVVDFLLDDFKIYNLELTEAQIKQNYVDEVAFNPANLIAYYGFENNLDSANNSLFNLTAQNTTQNVYEPGVVGQSRRFTTNPAYNDILGGSLNLGEFTIMAWEKTNVNQSAADFATIFETNGSLYTRRRSSLQSVGYAINATTYVSEGSTILQPTSQWVHHTIQVKNYNGSFSAVYYRNGEFMTRTANNTTSNSIHSFFDKFVIGGGLDGAGNLMNVKRLQDSNIDEVYVYNRVLSQPEILATMYRPTAPVINTCPTGNVTLTTQAEVDALATCTIINGNLTINATSVLDLTPLNNIVTINGSLQINQLQNTGSATWFQNLNSISGNIVINGSQLSQLSGFSNITNVSGQIQLINNSNLTTLNAFGSVVSAGIDIQNSPLLTSLSTFNNLTTISTLKIQNTALSNLDAFDSVTSITGASVELINNPSLNAIALPALSIVNFTSLSIVNNTLLSTCQVDWVCDSLPNSGITFNISGNATGCESLTAITIACNALNCPTTGIVNITNQAQANALLGCTTIAGNLNIIPNGITLDLSPLRFITTISGGLFINPNGASLDLSQLDDITSIGGGLIINSLGNTGSLTLFPNINSIGGAIVFDQLQASSINGFNNLTTIHSLGVSFCNNLVSFGAFNNVTSTTGDILNLFGNPNLTTITGLNNLNSLTFGITLHSNTSLTNLNFLNSLTTINGSFGGVRLINNTSLVDISGLNNLSVQTIPVLQITGNTNLSSCAVEWLCDYLDIVPNPNISGNATGCESSAVVINSCNLIGCPVFTQVAPICAGDTFSLPTTSNNGITGTWSPAINNQATTTYTFSPDSGSCATTITMTIVVNPQVTPTFTQVAPICAGTSLSALPTTSSNGIIGTWSPAINNQVTTTYTFTPVSGSCATTATMTIVVNPQVTPTFTQVAPICAGTSLSALPTTSSNGIIGTWSPAINNQVTTTYTFTPVSGS